MCFFFSPEDFSTSVMNQLWDRLQIICRQPYRKDIQFGLSFINVRSTKDTEKTSPQAEAPTPGTSVSLVTTDIKKHFFGSSEETNRLIAIHVVKCY